MEQTITMGIAKETKNTVVYEAMRMPEDKAAPAIRAVYVDKWALPTPAPRKISITLKTL